MSPQLGQGREPGICCEDDLLRPERTVWGAQPTGPAREDIKDGAPLMDGDAARHCELAQSESELGGMHRTGVWLDDAGVGRGRSGAALDVLGGQRFKPLDAGCLRHRNSPRPGAFLRERARGPQPPVKPQIHFDSFLPLQSIELGDRIRGIGAESVRLFDTNDLADLIQLGEHE